MGKLSTAARTARFGPTRAKRTSHHKLANKRRQRTPKLARKQMNKARLNRQEEMEKVTSSAQKRLQRLSFANLKDGFADNANNKPKQPKQPMSRNQRNKFSRQNKKAQKAKQKQQPQIATIDFTTYDRHIQSDESSQEEDQDHDARHSQYSDAEQKREELLQQFETAHKPKSWDVRKSKLSYQSATGGWIHDNEGEAAPNAESKEEDVSDGEVVINEQQQQITDYMQLGNMNKEKDELSDGGDAVMDGSDADDGNAADREIKKIRAREWKLRKKLRMNSVKLEIAEMGEKMLEDPYKNCGLLQVVYSLCLDEDVQLSQLAMLSITRIIIDVMPPYKIGTIDKNIALKSSKEKVREFEKTLLNSYQLFLKHIFELARIYHSNVRKKTMKRDPKRFILGRCAIKCILLFIRKCSHFNYTKELIKNVIPLTNCAVEEIRKASCSAIGSLLSCQPINNATVECVQLLTQRADKKNFKVHPDQISVLLQLPLQYLQPPDREEKEKQKTTKSRWEKEMDKKLKKDAADCAIMDKKKSYMRQKVIIEAIFGVYFYILKLEVSHDLLQVALDGMSKFAHLINIELILDLISVISLKLASESTTLPLTCKIQCVLTTFNCLSGRGTAIRMDVRQHYETMYALLLSVSLNIYEWHNFPLIFECLNVMFGHHASKSVPIDRIAAFVQRLTNISTQLPPGYAIACQHMARKLMLSDPRLYNMLDYEGGYDREFHPYETNPDHTNALSCCLWELTATSRHFHSFAKIYSRDLATWSEIPLKLASTSADKVLYKYDVTKTGNFRPFVRGSKLEKYSMTKHPPKELNNSECMTDMVGWFKYKFRGKSGKRKGAQRLKRITRAVVNGNKMATQSIAYYGKCHDLLARNRILKEINKEYKLLNEVLQTD